jgi:hypothetical protein
MGDLLDLLDGPEPHATFHDTDLLSLDIDYRTRELVAQWSLCVGDPGASGEPERERCREGRLRLRGLLFWVVEPPAEMISELPWLTADGLLSEAPTPAGRELAKLLPAVAVGWYLFFSDWNAFAYAGAESAEFEWV